MRTQEQALSALKRYLESRDEYLTQRRTLTEWRVEPTGYKGGEVWVYAQLEHSNLPEGDLLRVLDHEYWMALVGKRGRITIVNCPKTLEQFQGQYFLGMKIDAFRKDMK